MVKRSGGRFPRRHGFEQTSSQCPEVVAVGVETEEQLAMLRSHGCRLGQGNLFSVPEESKAAARMLHGTFESFEFTRSLEDPNTINMVETLRFNN